MAFSCDRCEAARKPRSCRRCGDAPRDHGYRWGEDVRLRQKCLIEGMMIGNHDKKMLNSLQEISQHPWFCGGSIGGSIHIGVSYGFYLNVFDMRAAGVEIGSSHNRCFLKLFFMKVSMSDRRV